MNVARTRLALPVVTAGCLLLVVRPVLWRYLSDPTGALVALFGALLLIGVAWPVPDSGPATRWPIMLVVAAIGILAFACGRILGGGHAPSQLTMRVVVLGSLAAVAEEAFFRRLLYGVFARNGPTAALVASTVLFALVHVSVYGWWVLPIDLAAGAVLGWQRLASGSWRVPAITHVLANLLVVI